MCVIPSLKDTIMTNTNTSEIICQNETNKNTILCDDLSEYANVITLDTRDKLAPV